MKLENSVLKSLYNCFNDCLLMSVDFIVVYISLLLGASSVIEESEMCQWVSFVVL